MSNKSKAGFALAVIFAINTMNFFDRQILGAVGELIKNEWTLSDTALGTLGTAFTLIYAVVGLPLGRLADKFSRKTILAYGVFAWSALTAVSGLAQNFFQMFIMRLGVGVGEATCAPAANSMIGDLYPATRRAKALSVFMLGLPIGIALSFAISGLIAKSYGWRMTFYVAGIPGVLCAIAAYMMREPARGATEVHNIGAMQREGSPFLLVLSIPTMWWLIAGGALHNFNMYTIGAFLTPFLMRFHALDVGNAGLVSMAVYGLAGIPGLLIGGYLGDAVMRKRKNGRLIVGALAMLVSVPFLFLGLNASKGGVSTFMIFTIIGIAAMYVYYSTVYSAIQDVVEPSLRGTAMAIYFFAMYVVGGSFGPVVTGYLSDTFTRQAIAAAGQAVTPDTIKQFAGDGLHTALYLVPILCIGLFIVLYGASRTVTKDMGRLEKWMAESAQLPVTASAKQ